MTDNSKSKGKKPTKDDDEEMTVVVPPSKKQPSAAADAEGDVMMGDEDSEVKVDPVVQTVAGEHLWIRLMRCDTSNSLTTSVLN